MTIQSCQKNGLPGAQIFFLQPWIAAEIGDNSISKLPKKMIYQVRRSKVDEIVGKLKKDPTNLYLLQEEFFIDEVLFRKLVLDSLKNLF